MFGGIGPRVCTQTRRRHPATHVSPAGRTVGLALVGLAGLAGTTGCAQDNESPAVSVGTTDSAIVNGLNEEGFPAVGALVTRFPGEDHSRSFCTGTLIDESWVLTAAHCLENLPGRIPSRLPPSPTFYLHFYIGSDTRTQEGSRTVPARRLILNPRYASPGGDTPNDVALIELESPVLDVVPLPLYGERLRVETATAITYVGFGATQSNSSGGGRKRRAVLSMASLLPTNYVTGQIGGGVCFGDSGGPGLLNIEGEYEVIGVNSAVFGDPACNEYSTQVRVDAHRTWIEREMGLDDRGCLDDSRVCACPAACGDDGVCDEAQCGAPNCGDITRCLSFCTDLLCGQGCFLNAAPNARYLYETRSQCFSRECPEGDADCINQRCRREITGCSMGLEAVTGSQTCSDIYRCQEDNCAGPLDFRCQDGCFFEGSLSAQAERDAVEDCQEGACADLTGPDLDLCLARNCRNAMLGCLPDEDCALTGGDCPAGTACQPAPWVARYCVASGGREVGDNCVLGKVDCQDGALCVAGSCREVCATAADCTTSFGPCLPAAAEGLAFSIGVCSLDCPDSDADGACDEADCDPWNPNRFPGAEEICDEPGVDEDCDGERNEGCNPEPPDAGPAPDLGPAQDGGAPDAGAAPARFIPEPDDGCRCAADPPDLPSVLPVAAVLMAFLFARRKRRRLGAAALTAFFLTGCGSTESDELDAGTPATDLPVVRDSGAPDRPPPYDAGTLGPEPDATAPPPPGIFEVQQGLVEPGTAVTLEGIVTARFEDGFFISELEARPFGAIYVASSSLTPGPEMGSLVAVEGWVDEIEFTDSSSQAIGSRTQLSTDGAMTWTMSATQALPDPLPILLPQLTLPELAEPYEGTLISLEAPTVTAVDPAGGLEVDALVMMDDQTLGLDDTWIHAGTRFERLIGVVQFDHRGFVVLPRSDRDAPRAPPVADGCLPLGDHLLCLSRRSWDDARVECAQRGGRLVIMETEVENATVSARVREHTNRAFWIAATDRDEEGTFLWTDGSTLAYDAWAENEPNDFGSGEDCAQGNFRSEGQWNDGRCAGRQVYVCEFDRPAPRCVEDGDCGEERLCLDGRCRPLPE